MSASNTSTTTTSVSSDDLSRAQAATSRRRGGMSAGVAIAIAVVLLLVGLGGGYVLGYYLAGGKSSGGNGGSGGNGPTYTITETGSSLIYPYMQELGPNFTKLYPNIAISPQSTGSGTGISSAEAGTVDIGGTDAYLSPSTASSNGLLNVPIAISAQLIFYNLPGITSHLNLNGTVIAMIYAGKITSWNDPMIAAANPGVNLPSNTIVPIHRSDGSGDTFMFTSFCYLSWSGWPYSYGTSVTWLSSSPGAQGNAGMVTKLQSTQYGIAYIGISYQTEAVADGLQYAAVGDAAAIKNGTVASNYVLPTDQTISEDATLGLLNLQPPSVAVSLILGGSPGATNLTLGGGGTMPTSADPNPYPIVNLEYTLIKSSPSDPAKQKWVIAFLEWALSYGNSASYLAPVHFLPLTPAVIGYDMQALQAVSVSS
jgi:phosphate transport system substrate-binding protein